MSAFALKLGSFVTTLLVLAGSFAYASTHVKNENAPLQPPVADRPAATEPPATKPTPIPSLVGTRRGNPSRPAATVPPLDLVPGVQHADLPAITFTHTS